MSATESPVPSLLAGRLWERLQDYFVSIYENSLSELVLFFAAALAFFLARHFYAVWTLRRSRGWLPLVVGGWGTRGKSGTERLKAALFNALGVGVASKTTGCEAMFVHAHPYNTLREMFLYRPYDKATIWEQRDVVRLADRLRARVFLWECMALHPAYVRLLQRQWMRDDITTITNAYPDHEDIQGPAGVDVSEVVAQFIPAGGRLLTSEEQMLPILAEEARKRNTLLRAVGWLEAGLLTPDVIRRFPYEEHPYNIALVHALAEELGIESDYALKEMADRVVPDLGVLRTTPAAPLRTRRLEFSNGMSANERLGCLSNWTRLGFDRQHSRAEPGVWITTVVNNRADRVARSRVFADVLVNDVAADRHVLIGGNLNGLQGYIRDAWKAHVRGISLWPVAADPGNAGALKILEERFLRMRFPVTEADLHARLRAMSAGAIAQGPPHPGGAPVEEVVNAVVGARNDPAMVRAHLAAAGVEAGLIVAILRHDERDGAFLREYQALARRVEQAEGRRQRRAVQREFHALLWKGFQSRIVVIGEYDATGNQIIDRICEETPPGFRNRIMGIQNIKGTGLDFVYRWLAWENCHKACALLGSAEPAEAEEGLKALAAFEEHGLLTEEHVREVVGRVRRSPLAQREGFQAQMDVILSKLDAAVGAVRKEIQDVQRRKSVLAVLLGGVESFLDAGDAIRRRKISDRIYEDLAAERISHERAALELYRLNERQKGGWLYKQFLALSGRLVGGRT